MECREWDSTACEWFKARVCLEPPLTDLPDNPLEAPFSKASSPSFYFNADGSRRTAVLASASGVLVRKSAPMPRHVRLRWLPFKWHAFAPDESGGQCLCYECRPAFESLDDCGPCHACGLEGGAIYFCTNPWHTQRSETARFTVLTSSDGPPRPRCVGNFGHPVPTVV